MNGKITIELGGVSTPLLFGMLAVEEFSRLQAKKRTIESSLRNIYDLVYAGYCSYRELNDLSVDHSYADIAGLVDELISTDESVIVEVYKCFTESRYVAKIIDSTDTDVKKKEPESVKPKRQTGKK